MEDLNLYPAWKQCVQSLLDSGLTYGSILRKETIATLCGLVEPETIRQKTDHDLQMLTFTSEIRKSLLTDHSMLLVSNYDGSYRVIEPRDQTAFAIECGARSIAKEIKRMTDGVQHVNMDLLSHDERRRNIDAKAKISMLSGMQSVRRLEIMGIALG